MGQTLSEPITSKDTNGCSNTSYRVASSCMQGWRIDMEDAHVHLLTLPEDEGSSYFAVFDGHGGSQVSQYASERLHNNISRKPAYKQGDIVQALKQGFLSTDEDMLKVINDTRQGPRRFKTSFSYIDDEMKESMAGTTAVTILIKNDTIYCANVGDSRAIASVNGKVQQLSFDHKPSNKKETERILNAGGWVEFNRVNGNLALSRALGDFIFKKNESKPAEEQIVTANPEVEMQKLTEDHEFILLACDGIWDVLSNEEVLEFVRSRIAQQITPETICEELMMRCLAPDCTMGGLGCDNMTVVLVCCLHNKRTYTDLSDHCLVQQIVPSEQVE